MLRVGAEYDIVLTACQPLWRFFWTVADRRRTMQSEWRNPDIVVRNPCARWPGGHVHHHRSCRPWGQRGKGRALGLAAV